MDRKPIKRHKSLQPLSREHHFGLLLCWKIRTGLKRNIEPLRIKKYTDWFWKTHLIFHFEAEEKYIFSILPHGDTMVKRAITEHRKLRRLFENENEVEKSLHAIEEELEKHIRFEERILFNEVQKIATEEQLKLIDEHHKHEFSDDWDDAFWQ
ncbi:MAG: hemerythrin domain-containing protein [Flavobacteriaceae bacterium]|jgi:iron-sulfur cluster repair protein YtfE (RIC family)|nr:hemerythrin domain-containing protein [Flavobacteriaceae bacterium]